MNMIARISIALATVAVLNFVGPVVPTAQAEHTLPPLEDDCMLCAAVNQKALWIVTEIPVCWEKEQNLVADTDKQLVRDAVDRTWTANSNLSFVGWGECDRRSKGIRISVRDSYDTPRVLNYGVFLNGLPDGMQLNFDLYKTGLWQRCSGRRDYCIEVSAIHEFGHALGFYHEQRRSDITNVAADCAQDYPNNEAIPNEWHLTRYDDDSVMNYCNPTWGGYGELSAGDIEALEILYHPD